MENAEAGMSGLALPDSIRISSWLLLGLLSLLVAACAAPPLLSDASQDHGSLTFEQLWGRRTEYAGQRVEVSGYYYGGFETSALVASPESNRPGEPRCWVSGQQPMFGATSMVQPVDGWVRLTGLFRYQEGTRYGHLGGYDCEFEAENVEEF